MANPKDEVALVGSGVDDAKLSDAQLEQARELSPQGFALPALSRERFLDPVQDSDGHPAVELA
jgi:hypothetical protein